MHILHNPSSCTLVGLPLLIIKNTPILALFAQQEQLKFSNK